MSTTGLLARRAFERGAVVPPAVVRLLASSADSGDRVTAAITAVDGADAAALVDDPDEEVRATLASRVDLGFAPVLLRDRSNYVAALALSSGAFDDATCVAALKARRSMLPYVSAPADLLVDRPAFAGLLAQIADLASVPFLAIDARGPALAPVAQAVARRMRGFQAAQSVHDAAARSESIVVAAAAAGLGPDVMPVRGDQGMAALRWWGSPVGDVGDDPALRSLLVHVAARVRPGVHLDVLLAHPQRWGDRLSFNPHLALDARVRLALAAGANHLAPPLLLEGVRTGALSAEQARELAMQVTVTAPARAMSGSRPWLSSAGGTTRLAGTAREFADRVPGGRAVLLRHGDVTLRDLLMADPGTTIDDALVLPLAASAPGFHDPAGLLGWLDDRLDEAGWETLVTLEAGSDLPAGELAAVACRL